MLYVVMLLLVLLFSMSFTYMFEVFFKHLATTFDNENQS